MGFAIGIGLGVTFGGKADTSPNLVANGTFDSDISGWTAFSAGAGTSVAWDGVGALRIDTATTDGAVAAYTEITTSIGVEYTLSFKCTAGTADYQAAAGVSAGSTSDLNVGRTTPTLGATVTNNFTASATTTFVTLTARTNGGTAGWLSFDDVSVVPA